MKKVLGIGNALVDVMVPLDDDSVINKLGFAKGSMTLVDTRKSREIKDMIADRVESMASGGSAANTIHGLGKLRAQTGFIGAVGEDTTGNIFRDNMKSAGVNTYLSTKDDDSGTAVAMVSSDSERTFATHLGAAEKLTADDLDRSVFKEYDYLYLEGYLITNMKLVETACKYAEAEGLKIAIDLASFNVVEAFKKEFEHIIDNYIDIIFANEQEARVFTGMEPENAAKELSKKCDIAVVKTGADGSLIHDGNTITPVEAMKVKSIDTTGAGDLYAAGFLYGLVNNADMATCGAIGTVLAGNVIEVMGPKIDTDKWNRIRKDVNENII
ncbi:MAG: adenosine kinase [Bacteroidales bacterium]|nr:adenosine kinase [Bacteroidales bacterium]